MTPVTSHMVAGGNSAPTALLSQQSATPFLATSAVPQGQEFPIHKWRPRDGRNIKYLMWEQSLTQLANAFGVSKSLMEPGALLAQARSAAYTPFSSASGECEANQAGTTTPSWAEACSTIAVENAIRINTAWYWHVRASLIIDGGCDFLADTRAIDAMATLGAVVAISGVWTLRQCVMLIREDDFSTPFVFPPAAIAAGWLAARASAAGSSARAAAPFKACSP